MNAIATILIFFGIAAVGYQLYVTLWICAYAGYTKKQKLLQCLLIWVFPILGVFLAHWILCSDIGKPEKIDHDFIREETGY